VSLHSEPDFVLGALHVSPSACRIFAGDDEIRVEAQTMTVLVVLAQASGATVPRDHLVDRCWQGRIVSDDAIARTIAKVRMLSRSTTPPAFVVETVPKVGFRLLRASVAPPPRAPLSLPIGRRHLGPIALVAVGAILLVSVWNTTAGNTQAVAVGANLSWSAPPNSIEFTDALLTLDEQRVSLYLRRGWNPNWHLDSEGNAALHNLMLVCERNPTHDQAGVARIAHLLVAAGADPSKANVWGDTPLRIARTPRYCGPDHPVVEYLGTLPAATGD
jgi:DNA-binding winged helix-turn-helix (wHTH) protein